MNLHGRFIKVERKVGDIPKADGKVFHFDFPELWILDDDDQTTYKLRLPQGLDVQALPAWEKFEEVEVRVNLHPTGKLFYVPAPVLVAVSN